MLVSHELKLLFSHVPKTGGSSITAALRPWLACPNPEARKKPIDARGWQQQWHAIGGMHSSWSNVAEAAMRLVTDGYKVATSTRSPFHRVASMWAIKGRPARQDPLDYFKRVMPAHCKRTIEEMAGPYLSIVVDWHDLENSWEAFLDEIGMTSEDRPELPHANKQVGVDDEILREVYSNPACVEWVANTFEADLDLFGYTAPNVSSDPLRASTRFIGELEG